MSNRGNFVQLCRLTCTMLHYLYICVHLLPAVLSRALPTSLDSPRWSMTRPIASLPTLTPNDSQEDGVSWHKKIQRFKCIRGTTADKTIKLECTMLGYDTLEKRSFGVFGSDSSLKEVPLIHTDNNSSWGTGLYPCWFETESQSARLVCEATSTHSRKIPKDAGLEALTTSLMSGLPISLSSEVLPVELDPSLHRYVSIYPTGDDYGILLTDAPHKSWPLEHLLSGTTKGPSDNSSLPILQTSTEAPPRRQPHRNSVPHLPQGYSQPISLIRCWFQLHESAIIAELNCAVGETTGRNTSDLYSGDLDSDLGSNIVDADPSDTVLGETQYRDLADSHSTFDEHPVDIRGSQQQQPLETSIDHWFFCWTSAGLKMLCEIPDWYTTDDHHPQSIHVRKAYPQASLSNMHSSQPKLSSPRVPLHFLVDSVPTWQDCRLSYEATPYGLKCINGNIHPATANPGKARKSRPTSREPHQRDTSSIYYSREKRDEIGSDYPAQNTTPAADFRPGKSPAFGRMGETFAYIGFFTIVAVFTVVLSWLVKHLFFAMYDGLEEWTDSRRRRRKLIPTKSFDISDGLNDHAPPYVSADSLFQEQVFTVTFPQAARIGEETSAVFSATGSQAAEANNDSIKRKKAAMRAAVAEGKDLQLG